MGGEKGSADTARDPRGFAVKFYTEDGNWDLVGNNTPVFFIRDPLKFGDFIHTQKREPRSNLKPAWMKWDFWSLSPESLHQVTILFSDRGLPDGYRHMDSFGSHTFSLINAQHERVWVKFHLKTLQGIQNLTPEAAARLAGENPDYATEDLFQAIEHGDYPRWRLSVQVMTLAQAEHFYVNPFDLTKVWPHKDHPLIEVGVIELDRNPQNYFAEVEQAAFAPANVVPGIGFSPDKMLQARILTYPDAHRYRLGVNYETLPVNRPRSAVNTYERDGSMSFDGNSGAAVNYGPNSFDGPTAEARYLEPPLHLTGDGDRYDHRAGNDDYTQAGNLFRLMDASARSRLVGNLVAALAGVPKRIQLRQLAHFYQADPEYGCAVAVGLDIQLIEVERLAQLSLPELRKATAL